MSDNESEWSIVCQMCDNYTSMESLIEHENEILHAELTKSCKVVLSVDEKKLFNIDKNVGIKCPRCSSRHTTYHMIQNRSADEGMTAICKCKDCFNNWSMCA